MKDGEFGNHGVVGIFPAVDADEGAGLVEVRRDRWFRMGLARLERDSEVWERLSRRVIIVVVIVVVVVVVIVVDIFVDQGNDRYIQRTGDVRTQRVGHSPTQPFAESGPMTSHIDLKKKRNKKE